MAYTTAEPGTPPTTPYGSSPAGPPPNPNPPSHSDTHPVTWVDHYLSLTVERDVYELSRLRHGHMIGFLLARLAGQTAQMLNIEEAARDVGQDKATTDSYVSLLAKLFIVYRLPPGDAP